MHKSCRLTIPKLALFFNSTPALQGLLCSVYWYLLWSSFNSTSFPPQCCLSLSLLSCSFPFSLSCRGKGLWKEVKYLGWSSDGAGNRTLDYWPPHPRSKDETTQQDPGLQARAASQNWALGRVFLLEHTTLMHGRGFPLLPATLPSPTSTQKSLSKFRKENDIAATVGSRKN